MAEWVGYAGVPRHLDFCAGWRYEAPAYSVGCSASGPLHALMNSRPYCVNVNLCVSSGSSVSVPLGCDPANQLVLSYQVTPPGTKALPIVGVGTVYCSENCRS